MADTGATACLVCSTEKGKGYWSIEGASACDQAAVGYYMTSDDVPQVCSDGVTCDKPGTSTETMQLEDGWFKFGTASAEVYECTYAENCKSPTVNASGAVGLALCTTGAKGPMCSVW